VQLLARHPVAKSPLLVSREHAQTLSQARALSQMGTHVSRTLSPDNNA
jgi:hypothetical protein